MDYKYKIRRLVKSGEENGNGIIFDKESTDKALKFYVEKFHGGLLVPLPHDNYSMFDLAASKVEDVVGLVSGFDDEYIYLSYVAEPYSYIIEAIQKEYYAQLCIIAKKDKDVDNLYITKRILQIRLCSKPSDDLSVIV